MILLDSNVVSELMLKAPNPKVLEWIDRQPLVSLWIGSVTVLELRFGIERLPLGRRRSTLKEAFDGLLEVLVDGRIAPLDYEAAVQTAILSASRMAMGRPMEQRDAMIAGIALANHASIATRNVRHFQGLNCPVIDPWD